MKFKEQPFLHPGASKYSRGMRSAAILILAAGLVIFLAAAATTAVARPILQTAEEGDTIFQTRCAGCHTIGGGKLVGPDLMGVTQQRDPEWLAQFILNPEALFAANDPVASALLKEYNNVKMPNIGLADAEVAAVIAYLESVGGGEPGAAAPAGDDTGQDAPVVGHPSTGELLFTGQKPLANGGTACQACHSVNGTGGLAGGTLGPDLTQVYTRYGENGLDASLTNIAFPSMVGIFADRPITPQERADLVAFFKEANQRSPAPAARTWIFLGSGLGLMLTLFAVLLISWPRQRQSLSERLRRGRG